MCKANWANYVYFSWLLLHLSPVSPPVHTPTKERTVSYWSFRVADQQWASRSSRRSQYRKWQPQDWASWPSYTKGVQAMSSPEPDSWHITVLFFCLRRLLRVIKSPHSGFTLEEKKIKVLLFSGSWSRSLKWIKNQAKCARSKPNSYSFLPLQKIRWWS